MYSPLSLVLATGQISTLPLSYLSVAPTMRTGACAAIAVAAR